MNKVNIFDLRKNTNFRSVKDPTASQWLVKWRVQGRDRTRSFRTKAMAETYRRRLFTALDNGDTFDATTGLPLSWTQQHITFAELAREYVSMLWSSHEASSNRSTVEALSYSLVLLTKKRGTFPFERTLLSKAAKFHILHPQMNEAPTEQEAAARDWILNNSLRLSDINGTIAHQLLEKLGMDFAEERALAPATLRKRKQAVNACFRLAVSKEYIKKNPFDATLFKAQKVEEVVDPARFLSADECREHVARFDAEGENGKRAGTFVSIMWLAGLRPGEALGLRKCDIVLTKGKAHLRVTKNVVQVGTMWTKDGSAQSVKQPKSRAVGSVRIVPIPNELAKRLRKVIANMESDELLFANAEGTGSLSLTVFQDAWVAIRKTTARLYDLRHTNASILIYSGLNIIEVAARLGHSVTVCSQRYLHVLNDFNTTSNAKVDTYLRGTRS